MRTANSTTTSANASLPAARSSIGSRRQAGSRWKNRYPTYWPTPEPSIRSYWRSPIAPNGTRGRPPAMRYDARMTKTQYFTATSIDGYIADADNSLDWLFEVPRNGGGGAGGVGGFFAGVGAMTMGAPPYEWVCAHERLDEHPEKWREWYGATPTWVFTHRRLPPVADGDVPLVEGDVGPLHRATGAA